MEPRTAMNRQRRDNAPTFRTLLVLATLAGGTVPPSAGVSSASEASRPNVVLINCDNLGYGDIGPFGSTRHRTPHLDRMAAEGMRFTDFYVTSGVCTPSRASLLTGCYPRRVNLHLSETGGLVLRPVSRKGLHPDEITIAEILKTRGYATLCIGKWHLGDQPEFLPTRQGFDAYFGIPYSDDMTGPPPLPLDAGRDGRRGAGRPQHADQPLHRGNDSLDRGSQVAALLRVPGPCHAGEHVGALCERAISRQVGQRTLGRRGGRTGLVHGRTARGACAAKDWTNRRWSSGRRTTGHLSTVRRRAATFPCAAGDIRRPRGACASLASCVGPARFPPGAPAASCAQHSTCCRRSPALAGTQLPTDRIIDGRDIWPLMSGQPGSKSPHEAFYFYRGEQLQAVRAGKWKLYLPLAAKQVGLGVQIGAEPGQAL